MKLNVSNPVISGLCYKNGGKSIAMNMMGYHRNEDAVTAMVDIDASFCHLKDVFLMKSDYTQNALKLKLMVEL